MHYGDKDHIDRASISIVVYKHEDLYAGGFSTVISSIQSCEYMTLRNINHLNKFFESDFKDKISNLKPETFYLVFLKLIDSTLDLKWEFEIEITDKMLKQNPLLGLH